MHIERDRCDHWLWAQVMREGTTAQTGQRARSRCTRCSRATRSCSTWALCCPTRRSSGSRWSASATSGTTSWTSCSSTASSTPRLHTAPRRRRRPRRRPLRLATRPLRRPPGSRSPCPPGGPAWWRRTSRVRQWPSVLLYLDQLDSSKRKASMGTWMHEYDVGVVV